MGKPADNIFFRWWRYTPKLEPLITTDVKATWTFETIRIVPRARATIDDYRPLPLMALKEKQPDRPAMSIAPHLALMNLDLRRPRDLVRRGGSVQEQGERWRTSVFVGPDALGKMKTLVARGNSEDEAQEALRKEIRSYQEDLVLKFVNRFGPLGLGEMTVWKKWRPLWDRVSVGVSQNLATSGTNLPAGVSQSEGEAIPDNGTGETRRYFHYQGDNRRSPVPFVEPFDAFLEAAREFQESAKLLGDIPKGHENGRVFEYGMAARTQSGVSWLPYEQEGRYFDGYNVPTLLAWCYYTWYFELTRGAKYRRCGNRKCGRVFLVRRGNENYCSSTCRRAEVARNRPDRILNDTIRELRKQQLISRCQAERARDVVSWQWEDGVHDEDTLHEAVAEELEIPLKRWRSMNERKENM